MVENGMRVTSLMVIVMVDCASLQKRKQVLQPDRNKRKSSTDLSKDLETMHDVLDNLVAQTKK